MPMHELPEPAEVHAPGHVEAHNILRDAVASLQESVLATGEAVQRHEDALASGGGGGGGSLADLSDTSIHMPLLHGDTLTYKYGNLGPSGTALTPSAAYRFDYGTYEDVLEPDIFDPNVESAPESDHQYTFTFSNPVLIDSVTFVLQEDAVIDYVQITWSAEGILYPDTVGGGTSTVTVTQADGVELSQSVSVIVASYSAAFTISEIRFTGAEAEPGSWESGPTSLKLLDLADVSANSHSLVKGATLAYTWDVRTNKETPDSISLDSGTYESGDDSILADDSSSVVVVAPDANGEVAILFEFSEDMPMPEAMYLGTARSPSGNQNNVELHVFNNPYEGIPSEGWVQALVEPVTVAGIYVGASGVSIGATSLSSKCFPDVWPAKAWLLAARNLTAPIEIRYAPAFYSGENYNHRWEVQAPAARTGSYRSYRDVMKDVRARMAVRSDSAPESTGE